MMIPTSLSNILQRLKVIQHPAGRRQQTLRELNAGAEPEPLQFEANQVFVIMPFDESKNETFGAIKRACRELGLSAHLADEPSDWNAVLEVIQAGIEKAQLIVCDLTDARPNVYYELGYAHGCGNGPQDTLLVAHQESAIHFDVRGLEIQRYDSPDSLRSLVHDKLASSLRKNEPWPTHPRTTPTPRGGGIGFSNASLRIAYEAEAY